MTTKAIRSIRRLSHVFCSGSAVVVVCGAVCTGCGPALNGVTSHSPSNRSDPALLVAPSGTFCFYVSSVYGPSHPQVELIDIWTSEWYEEDNRELLASLSGSDDTIVIRIGGVKEHSGPQYDWFAAPAECTFEIPLSDERRTLVLQHKDSWDYYTVWNDSSGSVQVSPDKGNFTTVADGHWMMRNDRPGCCSDCDYRREATSIDSAQGGR